MSCRFVRGTSEGTIACELLARGGWQQAAAREKLHAVGVEVAGDAVGCPVAARGQWARCPCRRVVLPLPRAPVRL
jgi:hypothetical protein